MAYSLEYLEEEGMLLVTNTGEMTYDEFIRQSRETDEVCRAKNCRLLLVDCTDMLMSVRTTEILDAPRLYDELESSRTSRVALVVSRDEKTARDLKFYETVCVNRGWPVKAFASRDSAMEWLREWPEFNSSAPRLREE